MNRNEMQNELHHVRASLRGNPAAIPSNMSGHEIRQLMDVSPDRMLIVRPAGGGMVQRVDDNDHVVIEQNDEFDDVPIGKWGDG